MRSGSGGGKVLHVLSLTRQQEILLRSAISICFFKIVQYVHLEGSHGLHRTTRVTSPQLVADTSIRRLGTCTDGDFHV